MSDFMSGLASGLLGGLGFGFAYDPVGDKRGELATLTSNFNTISAELSLNAQLKQFEVGEDLERLVKASKNQTKMQMDLMNVLIWNAFENTNLILVFIYILVFVIIIYLILKK
jgi:hypothetical protein